MQDFLLIDLSLDKQHNLGNHIKFKTKLLLNQFLNYKFMKTTKLLFGALFFMSLIILPSCLKDNDDLSLRYPNAIVTVKESANETLFFQLDDQTTLLPVNLKFHPYDGKEVRALINYQETEEASGDFDKAVHVNWIDSILTKPMAPNLGDQNDKVYGTDPVEIVADWVTIAEDDYLTLRFRTIWSNIGAKHFVNLISTNNPENPYEVEFRHNANGDVNGRVGDGLVAFKLDDLPDTEGETVKLKLIYKSFNTTKSVEFDYKTRVATPATSAIAAERSVIPMQ